MFISYFIPLLVLALISQSWVLVSLSVSSYKLRTIWDQEFVVYSSVWPAFGLGLVSSRCQFIACLVVNLTVFTFYFEITSYFQENFRNNIKNSHISINLIHKSTFCYICLIIFFFLRKHNFFSEPHKSKEKIKIRIKKEIGINTEIIDIKPLHLKVLSLHTFSKNKGVSLGNHSKIIKVRKFNTNKYYYL